MPADDSGRWKTGQLAFGVQRLGHNALADLNSRLGHTNELARLNALTGHNELARLNTRLGHNELARLNTRLGHNALAELNPLLGRNALAELNPLLGRNALAELQSLGGSAPSRAEAEAMAGMTGITFGGNGSFVGNVTSPPVPLDPPADLDAVPKRAGDQLRQVDPPCPVMQGSAVPPDRACFLLELFLGKADRETLRGDLEEEYTTSILPKYGARRARFWFWTQTVRTIATRNPVFRWWGLVYGILRLIIG